MFDLDRSIRLYMRQLVDRRLVSRGCADEIEGHLRDEIDDLIALGHEAKEAYDRGDSCSGNGDCSSGDVCCGGVCVYSNCNNSRSNVFNEIMAERRSHATCIDLNLQQPLF